MSHISPRPEQSTALEIAVLTALTNLANSPSGQFLRKTGATTFVNEAPVVSAVGVVPIGGSIAWYKSLTGTPALPAQFAELNGQTLSDAGSVYNGVVLPDPNGVVSSQPRFLRGATTSGGLAGADSHCHTVTGCVDAAGGHCHAFSSSGTTDFISDHSHSIFGLSFSYSGSGVTDTGCASLSLSAADTNFDGSTGCFAQSDSGHNHNFSFSGSGSTSSGTTDSAGGHSHGFSFSGSTSFFDDHTHNFSNGVTNTKSHLPSYINVVWIMRIK